jgi:hypothetical protein
MYHDVNSILQLPLHEMEDATLLKTSSSKLNAIGDNAWGSEGGDKTASMVSAASATTQASSPLFSKIYPHCTMT